MVNHSGVTVVVPVHPPRWSTMLPRALQSIAAQTKPVAAVSIAVDVDREGSGVTRNRALAAVRTRWTAFLDSDDEFYPTHIEALLECARATSADVVYSGCRVTHPKIGTNVPLREEWGRFGLEFDPDLLRRKSYIPVTSLVRTALAQRSSFVPPSLETDYDDWGFYLRLLDLGANFVHLPKITWVWHHGPHNTSGRPDRW